ncbi:MAG TPA: branched-chain amino acid ABC transporter permease [Candidatus Binatia bacterium]|nr:branched-chain amino acid ABC transporter permease [Candidatus Binatia bacterium]
MNWRSFSLLASLGLLLLWLPHIASDYILSLATLFLFFAYSGQAWNILMGFVGQLSLGHSAYLGVGAYAAAALYYHFGVGPWAGLWLAIALGGALGAVTGALAFRYSVSGVHFTLLTIALAEFLRIGFDHLTWVGASGGLFLKVGQRDQIDLLNLRGTPVMFYYVILALAAGAMALSFWLLQRRPGYYWRAIRENEDAAQALGIDTFRWKLLAMILSASMTSLGGVFLAFYYNNLFPEQVFHISRSIEIILGPIIGGMGTIFGPVLGAAVVALLADGTTEILAATNWQVPGLKQLIYGIALFVVVTLLPHGIWPALARKLKLSK